MRFLRFGLIAALFGGATVFGYGAIAGGADSGGPGEIPSVAPQPDYASDWSDARGPVTEGRPVRRGGLAVQLAARPAVVDQGANVGFELRNRGKVDIGWGYGEYLQRRAGGRWVPAWDAYRDDVRFYPDILLSLRRGETVGPDGWGWYGGPLEIVLDSEARPGVYRILKEVMPFRGRWPEDEIRATAKFRVRSTTEPPPSRRQLDSEVGVRRTGKSAARLWLDRNVARAGEELALTVENLGSTPIGFRKGGDVHGWSGKHWKVPGEKPGEWIEDDISVVPTADITLGPQRFGGPTYGEVVDRVKVPKTAQPGLYSVTKGLLARPRHPRRSPTFEISAWFRVVD